MARSQNGYPANDRALVSSRPVLGSDVRLSVRNGPAGDVLLAYGARHHRRVEPISNGRAGLDDWGYAERPIRGSRFSLSNHASGTAIDLNAPRHPLGARGTFTPAQVRTIRAILADDFDGVIRWGGDYRGRKDEMHFEVVGTEAECARVLAKLAGQTHKPGSRDLYPTAHLALPLQGADVVYVQRKIGVKPDGFYGPVTARRLKSWERAHNAKLRRANPHRAPLLLADGVVGVHTWRALGVTPTYKPKGTR